MLHGASCQSLIFFLEGNSVIRLGLGSFKLGIHGGNVVIADKESKGAPRCGIIGIQNMVKHTHTGITGCFGGHKQPYGHSGALEALSVFNLVGNGVLPIGPFS